MNNFPVPFQLTCDLNNILALKFILQQPSPVWLDFSITDVKLYKNIRTPYQNNLFSKWMKEEENKNDNPKKLDLDVAAISSTMQQMWALTQQISNVKCDTSLGRYEIDGIYDINLLTWKLLKFNDQKQTVSIFKLLLSTKMYCHPASNKTRHLLNFANFGTMPYA